MQTNHQNHRGVVSIGIEWLLIGLISCILVILTAVALMISMAKVASAPQMVKFMAAIGAGALFLITHLARSLKCPELHEEICQGYAIIFGAYFFHFVDDAILQADEYVQKLLRKLSSWRKSV